MISSKIYSVKKGFKCFTDIKNNDQIKAFCIMLLKMSREETPFDEINCMSFLTKKQ